MSYLDTQDDQYLTPSELALVAELSIEQIANIDKAILSVTDERYRKVAFIVGKVLFGQGSDRVVGIPDIFYSQRVAHLVSTGDLEARGNLKNMRYSEVKLRKTN